MVRDQLVCIVSENYERSAPLSAGEKAALDDAFRQIGRIHFAAFALLPPRPGFESPPSLLLELAVDDDLPHADLVALLEQQGFDALWPLYCSFWKGSEHASEQARRDWLREHLRERLHGADGGFVGMRDRNVGQVLAEARLFRAARERIATRPPASGDDRATVARELAGWAADKLEFRWAVEPPRRSFWRARWMSTPIRVLLALARLHYGVSFVGIVLVLLTLIAFAGVLSMVPFLPLIDWNELIRSKQLFGGHAALAPYAIRTTIYGTVAIAAIAVLGISAIRSVTVTVFLLLVFGWALLLTIIGMWYEFDTRQFVGFLGATGVLLHAGTVAIVGVALFWFIVVVAFLAALLIVPPVLGPGGVVAGGVAIVAGAAWSIHCALGWLVERGASAEFGLYPVLRQTLFGLPAVDAIVLMIVALFSAIGYVLSRTVKLPPFTTHAMAKKLDRVKPPREPLRAAHQVHPSIDACEAELVAGGRVNHMFSLTEIREPVWLNRKLLKYFLGLVTSIGHTVFTEGKLATAEGIRFGHWHVIDGGRRLLFCSNYDGAFGGYLDEFINGASEGVNLFWRWTCLRRRLAAAEGQPAVVRDRDYPPTRFGVFRGCKHEQWFKAYARDSMLPHFYRFEAYRFTAQDVERATRLREALFGPRNPVHDDQVMRALES
jgi:hypothetical protein